MANRTPEQCGQKSRGKDCSKTVTFVPLAMDGMSESVTAITSTTVVIACMVWREQSLQTLNLIEIISLGMFQSTP